MARSQDDELVASAYLHLQTLPVAYGERCLLEVVRQPRCNDSRRSISSLARDYPTRTLRVGFDYSPTTGVQPRNMCRPMGCKAIPFLSDRSIV
jgi:hypothetical protein